MSEQPSSEDITIMENSHDELMEDISIPEIHEAYFQFDDEEPIRFAFTTGGEFSLTLRCGETEEPEVEFMNGKGKSFKIFLKKSTDGI